MRPPLLAFVIACSGCSGFFDPKPAAIDSGSAVHDDAVPAKPLRYIQGSTLTQSTMIVQATYAVDQLPGDLNVVMVTWNGAGFSVMSMHDTLGNAYTVAAGPQLASAQSQQVFVAPNVAGAVGGANQVSVQFSATVQVSIVIASYRGIDPVDPLDGVAGSAGNAAIASSGSFVSTHPHDMLVTIGSSDQSIGAAVEGFTPRITGAAFVLGDAQVEAAASYGANDMAGNTGDWILQLIALRGAD